MYKFQVWENNSWTTQEQISAPSRRQARKRIPAKDIEGRHWRLVRA